MRPAALDTAVGRHARATLPSERRQRVKRDGAPSVAPHLAHARPPTPGEARGHPLPFSPLLQTGTLSLSLPPHPRGRAE